METPSTPNHDAGDAPDRDVLITRIIDQRASAADWQTIERIATTDGTLWREVALAQRDAALLSAAVGRAISVADSVTLESAAESSAADDALAPIPIQRGRVIRPAAWRGWATAAAVALAWFAGLQPGGSNSSPMLGASLGPTQIGGTIVNTPTEALDAYRSLGQKEGRVVGEVPAKILVKSTPVDEGRGGYDVVYIRQIVERARVADPVRFTQDEAGNAQPVTVPLKSSGSPL
ncbi:MAG: hypothetical protein SFY96_09900 [Planctomycetota bacterium]|nr:hypothetical protein [Planctomycetota bacterium]